jgi:predicted glycoside hydrolase/deacetylase ChbG (UPF0249 family)
MIKKLIVNADDYGHTKSVSLGIRQAHLNGIVTSTSVMMNRPDAVEGIRTAQKECLRLGLGLHLVLTTGKPVLPAEKVTSLVDSEGKFHRLPALSSIINEIDLPQVNLEWHAQIEAFKRTAGCRPDHLDSHHHISYFTPGLFELMLSLANELGCAIRVPFGNDDTLFADPKKLPDLGRFHPRMPQVFFGNFYDEGATLETLKHMVNQIVADNEHSVFELMCHPAVVDDEVRKATSYNDPRDCERELLQSREVKALLKQNEILLIRYADL